MEEPLEESFENQEYRYEVFDDDEETIEKSHDITSLEHYFSSGSTLGPKSSFYRLSEENRKEFLKRVPNTSKSYVSYLEKHNTSTNPTALVNILRYKKGFLKKGIDPEKFSDSKSKGSPHYWYDMKSNKYFFMGYKKTKYDLFVLTNRFSVDMMKGKGISKADYRKIGVTIMTVSPNKKETYERTFQIPYKKIQDEKEDIKSMVMVTGAVAVTLVTFHFLYPHIQKSLHKY